ncbi:MAG: helix-turn-helix domain-containing protein [Candidatus Bathyarchaeia archaeon]|nr:TrmB family transcriptional regulator [Candidatus Bathyarchaeota archaeon]
MIVQENVSILHQYQPLWRLLRAYLGFSEYEAKIYEFLVNEGPSTARKISIRCGVPRTKVYSVIRRLMEQNMVTELPLSPRLFIALSPTETLKPLIDIQEKIVEQLNEVFLHLQKKYEESTESKVLREEVWILTGERALRKVTDLLLSAGKNVEFFSSWEYFLHVYGFLREVLDTLFEKGVSVRLYFPSGSKVNKKVCRAMCLQYRIVRNLPLSATLIISIDNNCIILHPNTIESENNSPQESEWVIVCGKKLVNVLNKILSYFKRENSH